MKKLIIVSLFFFIATPGFCEYRYVSEYNGMDWNQWGGLKKAYIIQGIWIGQKACLLDNYSCYKYRQAQNVIIGDYTKELDQFYSTPKHRKVRILEAYVLATIKFKDDDSNDYKYALELFLENKRLPCGGMVSRVFDGDTIEVREGIFEGFEKWQVRLIGIDAPEINHYKQTDKEKYGMKAKRFLAGESLEKVVTLTYYEDLFDKHGHLSATVNLRETSLSRVMLHCGLAKPYPYHDPKRNYKSTGIEDQYELCEQAAAQARKEKLYIWGGKTAPYVEDMIKKGGQLLMKKPTWPD